MEEEVNIMKIAYLDEIGGFTWDGSSLTEDECAEWESIASDYRDGEDKKVHRARVSDFKERMDKKRAK